MYSKGIENLLKSKDIGVGDSVRVSSSKEDFSGILMPRPELGNDHILILKLENGFNIGIKFDESMKIEKLKAEKKTFTFPKSTLKANKALPKVTMIATGGTILSKIDYLTGGVHPLSKPEELLYIVPELAELVDLDVINLMKIMSEDMTYQEWGRIAEQVAKSLNTGSKGVVVTHGTDTMHYTSAALSFMLENLNAPVVLTGAQRSSDRGSSDAFTNLICSARIAANSDIAEVGICMHANSSDRYCNFIRGSKVRKMHTSMRDAFRPINNAPIATVTTSGKIEYVSEYKKISGAEKKKVVANTEFEPKVALVKTYPNADPKILDYYVENGYKGIIIEGTGLGNVPVDPSTKGHSWIDGIKRTVESGVVVGMTSQCLYGRVNDKVYSTMRLASGVGAVYCEDMLPEVAYVKLGFLLGNHSASEARSMLNKNLVGEITNRTEVDWFV